MEAAAVTAQLLANELGHGSEWQEEQMVQFNKLAACYVFPFRAFSVTPS